MTSRSDTSRRTAPQAGSSAPLARRLACGLGLGVGIVVGALLFGVSASTILSDIDAERSAFARDARRIAKMAVESLASEDDAQVERFVADLALAPGATSLEVLASDGRSIAARRLAPLRPELVERWVIDTPVLAKDNWFESEIGVVRFGAGTPQFAARLRERAPRIAFVASLAGAGAAAIGYLLAARLVDSPLRRLRAAMATQSLATNEARSALPGELEAIAVEHAALLEAWRDRGDALTTRTEDLETAKHAASRFLAVISHELRTPLNGVVGVAQVVQARATGDREREQAATILRSGARLSAIVDDLLDASNLDAGLIKLDLDPFDIRSVARSVVEARQAAAGEKGLRVRLDAELAPSERLVGDERRVGDILAKLTDNAIKFSDAGAVTLRIKSGSGFRGVRVEVVDMGPGVPVDRRSAIFDRFALVDDGDARQHGGAGLGLAICKGLVQLMGGRIGVTDAKSGGACFWVDLPLERIDLEAPKRSARRVRRSADLLREGSSPST